MRLRVYVLPCLFEARQILPEFVLPERNLAHILSSGLPERNLAQNLFYQKGTLAEPLESYAKMPP